MNFDWGTKTYVMGIVNVTPDSFSGDGVVNIDEAIERGVQMEKDGADMLDVGGESTRPGSTSVSLEEELRRVIPVVEGLSKRVSIPISIDTYKAEVATAAIASGASLINDVWAGRMDPQIVRVAAETGVHIVLMHNRSEAKDAVQSDTLGGRYIGVAYGDLMGDIKRELGESVQAALTAGIKKDRIVIDPGIGFGKTVEQNLEIVRRLGELKELGYPILVGPSRKSFVGYTLDTPPSERLEGTIASVVLCIERGADIVRVHDVKEVSRAVRFVDALERVK